MVDTLVLGTSAKAWEFESLHAQFERVIQFSVSPFQCIMTIVYPDSLDAVLSAVMPSC